MLAGHPGGRCPIGMQPAIVVGSTAQVTVVHIIDKHITKTSNAIPGVIGFGRFVLSVSVDIKSRENSAVMASMRTTGLSYFCCSCCLRADAHSKRQPTELITHAVTTPAIPYSLLISRARPAGWDWPSGIPEPRTDIPESTWSSIALYYRCRTHAHSPLPGFLVQSPWSRTSLGLKVPTGAVQVVLGDCTSQVHRVQRPPTCVLQSVLPPRAEVRGPLGILACTALHCTPL